MHKAELQVSSAQWHPQVLPYTDFDRQHIQTAMASFWRSKFTSDALSILSSKCAGEMATGKPCISCIDEMESILSRIDLAEREEAASVMKLSKEVQNWCGLPNTPVSARLLYEPDPVSDLLWSAQTPTDCKSEDVRRRKEEAMTRLAQYRELVTYILRQEAYLRSLLDYHIPHSGIYGRGTMSIIVRNSGDGDGSLDLRTLQIDRYDVRCSHVDLVSLDSYTYMPTLDNPPILLKIPGGSSAKIELSLDCGLVAKSWLPNMWQLASHGTRLSFTLN
ncbi:MAG: hypothetical protein QM831_12720 [Kofleriaceae bacterium]